MSSKAKNKPSSKTVNKPSSKTKNKPSSKTKNESSSNNNADISQLESLYDSIINHLFLPCNLPESADADYLIKSDHRNEYKILDYVNDFLSSMDAKHRLPIFVTLKTCIKHWLIIQNIQNCSVSRIQSIIQNLERGDFLPLYFHTQNAAILIEIDENSLEQPLISAWQVSLPTDTITSSLEPHISHFPSSTYRLFDVCQLTSQIHCELLMEFMTNTIEHSKSYKASHQFDEQRDIPISHYVCQWWITQFPGIQIDNQNNSSIQFQKKHRDQIRWKNAILPFRRSGLWMTIKVVFHTILTKRLGKIGTIVYKLLMTDFLTYIICERQRSVANRISIELLMHCLRKIARRLNKIESLLSLIDSKELNLWIQNITQKIKEKFDCITPKDDWQKGIKENEANIQRLSVTGMDLNQPKIYQHTCDKLKVYLDTKQSDKSQQHSINNHHFYSSTLTNNDVLEGNQLPSVAIFTDQGNYPFEIALIRIEIWIESYLEKWINRPIPVENEAERFENVLSFFEDYQRAALNHYFIGENSSDPVGYSRYILTSLTIIRLIHQKLCADLRFNRLKLHKIDIPNLLYTLQYLVLPNRDEMIRARNLFDFFHDYSNKPYPDILNDITSSNAFGIYLADDSISMKEILDEIQTEIQQDIQAKTQEIAIAENKYRTLMQKASNLKCECNLTLKKDKCERCSFIQQANDITVNIYERPIPSERESALAVIFELGMPTEFRCYRDIIWMFINRPNLEPSENLIEWLDVSPHGSKLKRFFSSSYKCRIKLVSSTKSISQTHYNAPQHIVSTSLKQFFFENSLKVEISPTKPIPFEDECRILTPKLTSPNYKYLQFSIENTQFVQNQVIAEQWNCALRLKPTQFIDFGSFRSGHRLQWWNLLATLELDSLSMDEESVAILISHSLLQYGPITLNRDGLIALWCPESHQILLDNNFVNELVPRLDRLLADCESNWQNELVLVIITIIIMRILTICNSKQINLVVDIAIKCRHTGEKWIELILNNIQNASSFDLDKLDELRSKIVTIGIACLLTFSTHEKRIHYLLSSNQHIVSLLKVATTVHDNIILSKNKITMSVFIRNLMRLSEHMLVSIHPIVSKYLQKTSYQSLNDFSSIYWYATSNKHMINGAWRKRNKDIYDGWYDGQYKSTLVSINCLKGIFLVNNMTISFLPDKITSNELFLRVFGHHVFEVQASQTPNTYITKHAYHGDKKVHYEFNLNEQNQRLTITERHIQTNKQFELIPSNCFQKELPDIFISNYSHWKDRDNQEIEFRPVCFQDSNFLNDKHYILTLNTGYITTNNTEHRQILINRTSEFFQNLFKRYFIRLDDEPYVYMLRDNAVEMIQQNTVQANTIIHIHLSRFGIAFTYDACRNIIISREYSDMYVNEDQWVGTLIGLQSGLLLSSIVATNQNQKHGFSRKLIVPFGQLRTTKLMVDHHQTVTIDRKSSTLFLHQYFVFTLNDRLRILQSTDSPAGWLYLALLHAMTSNPLPDIYTGMTGMERAFQLLNSAGCWSDQPFDLLCSTILFDIASLSPQVSYYPDHLTCMIKIEWNSHDLPRSMQHFGYYLIAKKIFQASEQWNFMYSDPSSNYVRKLFESKNYNEKVLEKLYYDYRDSYNPTARLSAQIELEIRSRKLVKPYEPIWENFSPAMNYRPINLVNGLYISKNIDLKDSSELQCFPLCRWLMSEYKLENIWIGLFKYIEELKTTRVENRQNEIEQFDLLLNFLHYISQECSTEPFYLQLLKSILKSPTITLRSVSYPTFGQYKKIDQNSFLPSSIKFPKQFASTNKSHIALQEVQNCFNNNLIYLNHSFPQVDIKTAGINNLLTNWRVNREFRSFLDNIQNHINTIQLVLFNDTIKINPPRFSVELYKDHYQIQLNLSDKSLDQTLLENAKRKFLYPHSDYFIKPISSVSKSNQEKIFPSEIFPSTDPQINPLSDIAKHFKDQLTESWKKFQSTEEYQTVYPNLEEINKFLDSFRQESEQIWNELIESITSKNEVLFKCGLMLRIVPTTLISIFLQIWLNEEKQQLSLKNRNDDKILLPLFLTIEQRTLLGGIMINWIVEQQIERAIYFANHDKWEEFGQEISNVPHTNWIPAKHVPWLIMELEMNITIREIQVDVALHMTQPTITDKQSKIRNIVMQMNMGEGKTSVIIPMLAVSLCSFSSSLVRIVVLKSLFPTNYQSLRYKLGSILNRRILPFTCRRDMNFKNTDVTAIFDRLQQGIKNCDIILTSPEDILSFDLLAIDKCRRGNDFDTGRSMLSIQRWLKTYVRDVFDESDEILHVKYQLIYSIGAQQQVDAGMERWKTIQSVLNLVKQHAANIAQQYTDDTFYIPSERQSNFPEFRLLSHRPYSELCKRIVNDWINGRSYRQIDQKIILSFILDNNSSLDSLNNRFSTSLIQLFLIMRGLLSSEVLFVALKKRHRVNFGVNRNPNFKRLMAVPYRAKDVAAENTEFGHPDIAIILTQLSYYYGGLTDKQMFQCFNRLNQDENDPDIIYTEWISNEGENSNIDPSIKQWKAINIEDYQQRTKYLFPTLCHNMLVVNYYLNNFVFPREAKQFPHRLVSSAWDLSSSLRSKIITGFSGTNDTQLLLPVHIDQYDLPKLQKTDAVVLNNLLQSENENYQSLAITDGSDEILQQIVNYKSMIQVILDVGALFIDGTNRQIAIKWLDLSDKDIIDYAVYFRLDEIFVCDRLYQCHPFLTSPASERLERCVFYLDEIHTRGTDFKFPNDFRAAVTLGTGLSKDRLVQACMRMRKLGQHHWLSFWSSNDVHQQIQLLKRSLRDENQEKNRKDQITLTDILRWVYENTQYTTWDGLHHWAAQSLSYQRKVAAFQNIHWNNHQEIFTDPMMKKLAKDCLEAEVVELKSMYGTSKMLQTVSEVYSIRYKHADICSSPEIHNAVNKRLNEYGGSKKFLAQLLDEEQQRELQQELEEERQQQRPPPVRPYTPTLHDEIKSLSNAHGPILNLSKLTAVFSPIADAFLGTTFYEDCQPQCWQRNLWISTEFKRVIKKKEELLDAFLRPPRWIVVYHNQHIIFVSPFEANWLMGALQYYYYNKQFKKPPTITLRLLLPRIKRNQAIFVNTAALKIPPTIVSDYSAVPFCIPIDTLVALFVFNGTLYFETTEEQTVYCQCLGVCPQPRTAMEQMAFEEGWIGADGFVEKRERCRFLSVQQCHFHSNPLLFIRKLIENRNNAHAPLTSHVGNIIFNATKHTFPVS